MIITFSGKSCSGKSSLASYLCTFNERFVHLSIDEIGHDVTAEEDVRKAISMAFDIPLEQLTRKTLGAAVFNSQEKMQILTDITWQRMERKIDDFIEANSDKIIILDWILIPKTKYFEKADLNILVQCSPEIRVNRAVGRDGITKEKFFERERAAIEYSEETFDYVINNDSLTNSRMEIRRIYDESIVSGKF